MSKRQDKAFVTLSESLSVKGDMTCRVVCEEVKINFMFADNMTQGKHVNSEQYSKWLRVDPWGMP